MATNVAESSLTVPGIRYVIDTGTARISRYSARSQVQRLPIEPISQASADQRKGRCGRIGPGICIRLYSEEDYESRDRFTPPEIQRTNLASVILQTMSLNLGHLEDFPFLDPPKSSVIRDGYKTLFELGALDEKERLTEIGKQLSRLPVDPRIGRMILAGQAENCLHEVLIIASALELQDPRERPLDKQQAADAAHEPFKHEDSDFLSYLKLWDFYHKLRSDVSRSRLRKACRQHFLSYNRLREWADIYQQLLRLVEEAGFKLQKRKDDFEAIHRALLTGLLSNIAYRAETYEYTGAGGTKFQLWPGSGLVREKTQVGARGGTRGNQSAVSPHGGEAQSELDRTPGRASHQQEPQRTALGRGDRLGDGLRKSLAVRADDRAPPAGAVRADRSGQIAGAVHSAWPWSKARWKRGWSSSPTTKSSSKKWPAGAGQISAAGFAVGRRGPL